MDFLATSRGQARVRALHHLSGGNHRIYIVLSQFITRDSIEALVEPFMQMGNRGVLLDLASAERGILEQAFGLAEDKQSKPGKTASMSRRAVMDE